MMTMHDYDLEVEENLVNLLRERVIVGVVGLYKNPNIKCYSNYEELKLVLDNRVEDIIELQDRFEIVMKDNKEIHIFK